MSTQTVQGWVPEDSLAHRLVLVRRQLGLSQREAALRTGLTFGEWQSLEDGRSARGLDVKVGRISTTLGVDREWLMWGGPLAGKPGPGLNSDWRLRGSHRRPPILADVKPHAPNLRVVRSPDLPQLAAHAA